MEAAFWFFLLVGAFFTALIGAWLGSKVHQEGTGFWLGLLLGPIGWIIVLLLPREADPATRPSTSTASHSGSIAATKWSELRTSTDIAELSAFIEAFPGTNEAYEAAKHKQTVASWRAADQEDLSVLREFYHRDDLPWLKLEIWEAIRRAAPKHTEIAAFKTEVEKEEDRQREQEEEKRRVEAEQQRVIAEEEAERRKAREIKDKKNAYLVMWISIGAVVIGGSVYIAYHYQKYQALSPNPLRAELDQKLQACLPLAEQRDELVAQRNAMPLSPERDELASRIEELEYDKLPECMGNVRQLQDDLRETEAETPNNFFDYLVSGSN